MAASSITPTINDKLLFNVIEQIKLPLSQIGRQAELGRLTGNVDLTLIERTADTALTLLNNFLFSVQLEINNQIINLESVSIASMLYDTGQALSQLANNYSVDVELSIAGKYGPVMANKKALQTAFVSLGSDLIESLPAQESHSPIKLQLATHRCRYGIVAGMYVDSAYITSNTLRQGHKLYGQVRQPLAGLSHRSGAGIFVAEAILKSMNLSLKSSRHHGKYGFGTILQPNHQLELI